MSGIAGIISLPFTDEIAEKLLLSMKHRGPDRSVCHQQQDQVLLLVDKDPIGNDCCNTLSLEWAGEQYIIVLDGFLCNRQEIIRALTHTAYVPEGRSDAELILRGYLCWGAGVLTRINGVFAFSITHQREGKVFLARDRLGVRPLFYMQQGKGLLFASEMKTILSYPKVDAQLDAEGAAQLLLLGPGRAPASGILKGIYQIEPGHYAVFQGGNLQLRPYWKLLDRHHTDSFEDTVEHVRYLVMDSIRCQLPRRQKAGTMLSGGLDSSVVSAVCARELDSRGQTLETFSLDYMNNAEHFVPGRFQPNMDTDYIRMMQDTLDSSHHWTILTPENLVDEICNATIARDLPGMADIDSSLLAFCRQIRPHCQIVLSGECADEIFGGYPWYRDPDLRDSDGFPWAQTIQERNAFLPQWVLESVDPKEYVRQHYLQSLARTDILPENNPQDRRIKELTNLNIRWFMQTLLERGDRMGNFAGVEIRSPFCDYRIAEYLYCVPWSYKDYRGTEKGLLRKAMEGLLPDSVLYRKKSPFPKTYDPKYLELVSQLLNALLNDHSAPIFQLVRKEALENLLHQDFPMPWYGQLMRRPQTIVYMLQINYWLEHYSVRIV